MTLVGVPTAVVFVVVMLVVPLPTQLIDLLITLNLVGSVIILLTSMYVKKALDFSVFPSLLLIATMYRLALNVSVTRQVLLHARAGNVVAAFGHFVIGGSLVVGLVVFLIIIVIQFIVITNGAQRVAEVAARFTLDGMPGKQMAIDADLNSGLINKDEARRRRREVADEADFYGAMDGASKFVRGDAIAAIVIMLINLVGGFAIGVLQNGDSLSQAISTYSLLSVGDGLASQLPALLISISTGIIVTRAGTESDLGTEFVFQILQQRRAIRIAALAVTVMALVPGLPKLPFLLVGGTIFLMSGRLPNDNALRRRSEKEKAKAAPAAPSPDSPEGLARDMKVDPLELEVSFNLVELVDPGRGGDLLDRVKGLRRKIALELGVVLPLVRTRDNIDLPASTYTIKVQGAEVARGTALPGHVLAIGDMLGSLPGSATKEPVFGLDAKWVPVTARAQAERMGATVVDPASVITTHLSEVVKQHAGKMLTRSATKELVEIAKRSDPTVVEELGSAQVTLAEVQRVLRDLLEEGVSVRNLSRIFEVVTEKVRTTHDPETLVEASRQALGPALSAALASSGRLPVITLDPMLEHQLTEVLRTSDGGSFLALPPDRAEALTLTVAQRAHEAEQEGEMPVLVCAAPLRPALRKLVHTAAPRLPVLSYAELGSQLRLDTRGVVNLAHATV
jgi:flagellar biosynthesis protein FlhA